MIRIPAIHGPTRIPARYRSPLAVVSALLLLAFAGPPVASSARAEDGPIPLTEIQPGMTGYGLSVFRGAKIDTFGVRVIGVQDNTRTAGSLILIEISGQGLEEARVVQGMSGSPVFLEGRFAGALAFGWPGSLSPIAGVTPAAEILALPGDVPASRIPRSGAGAVNLTGLAPQGASVANLAADLERSLHSAPVTPATGGEAPALVPELPATWPAPDEVIGALLPELGANPDRWLCRPLASGPRRAAGPATGRSGQDATLQPGSACAVPLILGDALLGAIGTVTWVQGERVFMMGHPFLQRGPVSLPLAAAEIHTILPNRDMSFKMGSIGEVVGAVHHDQRAGLSGRLGAKVPLVPVAVTVASSAERSTYRFEVAEDPQLTPGLVFWALYNSLLVEGNDAGLQTVDYEITTRWAGPDGIELEPLVLTGRVSGDGGVRAVAGDWMSPVSLLLNNPFASMTLTGVEGELRVSDRLTDATIVGLTGPSAVSSAGEELVYRVELALRGGERIAREFAIRLPRDVGAGPYRVVAASAAELFALETQRAPGRFQVRGLDSMLEILRTPRSAGTLVVAVLAPGRGLVLNGNEMSSLPGSMHRVLQRADMQAQSTLADYVARKDLDTEWALQGHAVQALRIAAPTESLTEERRP